MRKLILLWLVLFGSDAFAQDRPNFVFIISDDQRFDALGLVQREQGNKARFPFFQTPHLDRLAGEGVRFRNAFVVSALCSPSRAAFLTGRYNHLNGVANNGTPFPTDAVTYATELRKAGYATGYAGKWHMGQDEKRPGFSWYASFVGQGKYVDCPFLVNGKKVATAGWVDDVSTDYAIEFIRGHKAGPFSVTVGFKSSHGPWEPPARLKGVYEKETIATSPSIDTPAAYAGWTAPGVPAKKAQPRAKAANVSRTARNYLATLKGVDENVGRLLAALDELKLAQNTVVVFTSDNGFYLGDHGLSDKRSAYEESIRVPLLVRYPKLVAEPRTVDAIALNIDLAPTFLDLAGVPVPASVQGKSWRPLLKGETPSDWRKSFLYEYFWERRYSIPANFALRTDTHKLIKYPANPEWTEVFDLRTDPHEMHNLAHDPARADLRRQLEAEFDRETKAVDFKTPDYAHVP